jgi:hypothetical protein
MSCKCPDVTTLYSWDLFVLSNYHVQGSIKLRRSKDDHLQDDVAKQAQESRALHLWQDGPDGRRWRSSAERVEEGGDGCA